MKTIKTESGRTHVRMKNALLRLIVIILIMAFAALLSGFVKQDGLTSAGIGSIVSMSATDSDAADIDDLLQHRRRIMQRCMFGACTTSEFFTRLSQTETYPALSEDYKNIFEAKNSDQDKIINMKTEEVRTIDKTRRYGIYYAEVKWYMSGIDGFYTENVTYRIRTDIVNGVQYLAEITAEQNDATAV